MSGQPSNPRVENLSPDARPTSNAAKPGPAWARRMWIPLVIFVLCVYGRTVSFGLFQDDYLLARPWSWGEVIGAFHGPFDPTHMNQAYFRPFASVSFALEWMVWHTTLWGYHLTNLAL